MLPEPLLFAIALLMITWFFIRPWMLCRDIEQENATLPSYGNSYFMMRGFGYLGAAALLFTQYLRLQPQQRGWSMPVIGGLFILASLWTFYWGQRFMKTKKLLEEKKVAAHDH